jgi:amidohydrolase
MILALLLAVTPLPGLDRLYPDMDSLYRDLHQSPELSFHEEKSAAKMADRLKRAGFEVTTGVGKTGVVGVLRNGPGPTVLLRTELDALPVPEKTGLPYASKVTTKNDAGETVPVMHACGHDVHMTSWVGAATLLAQQKDKWHGTLVMIAQPAEEIVGGATAMLADGLFQKWPKPDYAIAVHDTPDLASGTVAIVLGPALANVDTVEITIHGRGSHGAKPQASIDPIVIASALVLRLQAIIARELNPLDPAVITVGSFHAGTKSNIIPDDAKLQLTVRSYKEEVQKHLLASIARMARAEAAAAGATQEPTVWIDPHNARATVNDPALSRRLAGVLGRALGTSSVVEFAPQMVSEDFSEYSRAGVPAVLIWVGATAEARLAQARAGGAPLPSLHSSGFYPDRERTIRTAVSALTYSALDLFAVHAPSQR